MDIKYESDLEAYLTNKDNFIDHIASHFYSKDFIVNVGIYTQVKLPSVGIVDMIGLVYVKNTAKPIILVVELKINKLSYNEMGQISRYTEAIKTSLIDGEEYDVRGVLVGTSIDTNSDFYSLISEINTSIKCIILNINLKIESSEEYGIYRDNYDSIKERILNIIKQG